MKLDLKKLNEQIKNKIFDNLYLFYGEERYLVEQYKTRLSSAIIDENDQFNLSGFSGKSIDVKQLIATADTMPFFSDKRLILVENSGFFKSSNDELLDYLKEVPDHAVFLFVETETDKRSKLLKYFMESGNVLEFKKQKDEVLRKWLIQMAKREEISLSQDDANLILEKCGNDMNTLNNEMKKLCSYCQGQTNISTADINMICTDHTPPQIFEMVRAMSEKNAKETLDYYYELLENKEPPMRILSLIANQFLKLYKVSVCRDNGESSYIISGKIGLSSYIVDKLIRQASNFSTNELSSAIKECSETEQKIKTGLLTDKIGVELLLVKYSTK